MKIFLAAVAITFTSFMAYAQTVPDTLSNLIEMMDNECSSKNVNRCESYISGVVLGATTFAAMNNIRPPFCLEKATDEGIHDAIRNILKNDNRSSESPSSAAILVALAQSYPCIQEQKTIEIDDELYTQIHGGKFSGNQIGNGQVPIAIFHNYDCTDCIKTSGHVGKIHNAGLVTTRFYEIPTTEVQNEYSRFAIAAAMQNKGEYFYTWSVGSKGKNNKRKAMLIAAKLDLDLDKFVKDANSDIVKETVKKHQNLAKKVGISSLPAVAIGKKIYLYNLPFTVLQKAVLDSISMDEKRTK